MPPTKEAQAAVSRARELAGIDPALNTAAAEGTEGDGARGDPGDGRREQRQGDPEPQRPPPPAKSVADIKRDDILKRFRVDRGGLEDQARDEISDFQRTGMPPEFEPPAEVRADPLETGEQQLEPEGEVEGAQDAPAPRFKVKVHGVEREVTLDDLIANAQKAMASDNILEESKSKLKELDTLINEARTKVARVDRPDQHQVRQTNTQTNTGEQPDPNADPEHHEDPLVKLIEAMQFGDPKEAVDLLRNTIAQQAGEQVQQQLKGQRLQDEGARAAKVLAEFEGQHPDIAKDPMARAAIEAAVLNQQVDDIKALGVNLNQIRPDGLDPTPGDIAIAHRWYRSEGFKVSSPETMLENATTKFLDWKGTSNPKPADPAPVIDTKAAPRIEISVDRTARRAAVPQQPKPSGATPRQAAPAAPQVRDRSAIVADMMGSRNKPRGRVGITN